MTIIKLSKDGKAIVKKKVVDESLYPLAPESTGDDGSHVVHMDVLPTERTKKCVNMFLLIMALMVLAAGIIGGVYLYKYMAHKLDGTVLPFMNNPKQSTALRHNATHIRVQYKDVIPHAATSQMKEQQTEPMLTTCVLEEDIEILEEEDVEKIQVPQFDECKSSVIIHDFQRNLSVIVDNDDEECFLMKLDRKRMSPPKSFADLLAKYSKGYYMPKVEVVRRDYRVVTPKIHNIRFAGNMIGAECIGYNTYWLEKKTPRPEMFELHYRLEKTYGFSDLKQVVKDKIYRRIEQVLP